MESINEFLKLFAIIFIALITLSVIDVALNYFFTIKKKRMYTFEIYEATNDASNQGKWRWRMKATNGNIIADSGEGYHNADDCLNMVRKFRNYAANAEIKYLPKSSFKQ